MPTGRVMVMTKGEAEDERVVGIATRLFAELGFDGTSIGMIADAAGMDAAALATRTGGKRELYLTVMERAHQAEMRMLQAAMASFTPTPQGVADLIDAYLDFHVEDPWTLWLTVHRWMGDAADIADLEVRYRRPMTVMVADVVRDAVPAEVDVDFLLWTVAWSVTGFLTGGMMRSDRSAQGLCTFGGRGRIDPGALADFRSYLHVLIERMTAPG